jgi:hypothetical protein
LGEKKLKNTRPNEQHQTLRIAGSSRGAGLSGRGVFHCPAAKIVDQWRDDASRPRYTADFWNDASIGIQQYLIVPYSLKDKPHTKLSSLKNPSTTVFCQDSVEQRMEGGDDSPALFPGYNQIMTEWTSLSKTYYNGYNFTAELFRHNQRNVTMWVSGNVTTIRYQGLNKGADYRWYTGMTRCRRPEPLP